MPHNVNHFVVEYQLLTAGSAALMTTAVNALIGTDPYWQPWGTPFADTHGSSVEYHQAMVRFGPEASVPP